MKPTLLLLTTAITGTMMMTIQSANAQGAYINAGVGYGMKAASQTMQYTESVSSDTILTFTSVHGSLGKGLNYGGALGYMFNKHVGAEIGFNYLKGSQIKSSYSDYTFIYTQTQTITTQATMLRIIPTLVIAIGDGVFRPYAKVGLVMGLMGKTTDKYSSHVGGYSYEETWKSSGGIPFGFSSALGLTMEGDFMAVFAEFAMINQSWAPKKSVMTESTYNGTDQLPLLTTYEKETNYVDSYSVSQNPDLSSPNQQTKQYLPMSSFGFNVGLRFNLGNYLKSKKAVAK